MHLCEYAKLAIQYRRDPFQIKYLYGRQVLDVGCGTGDFLASDPLNIVGIDLNPHLVDHCVKRGFTAYCMSALDLEFPDESFDAVHVSQLIEHFLPGDAIKLISEAARVLRPGGHLFLTTPGVRNVWGTFSHIRPYPPAAIAKLLSSPVEGYIRGKPAILMQIKCAQGYRRCFSSKLLTFMSSVVDLIFSPSDPIGWTIVLQKQ